VVVSVSLVVATAPLAKVTAAGTKVQDDSAGRFPQENVTVPLYVPTAVIVRSVVADCPAEMIAVVGVSEMVKSGVATVTGTEFEKLERLAASPA